MHADVVIVGAGPVGAALALLARESRSDVRLLEARAGTSTDQRTLALSYGTRLILEQAGAWPGTDGVTPIKSIHVSQQGAFGRTVLAASDADVPALGYVLGYANLQGRLDEALQRNAIPVERGATVEQIDCTPAAARIDYLQDGAIRNVTASLVVLADGGANVARIPGIEIVEKDYRQTALVAGVTTDRPHGGIAYERFTPAGPAALLPKGDAFSLVWTAAPEEVARLLALDDKAFLAELDRHFGRRAGRFTSVARRAAFPLKLKHAVPRIAARIAVVGAAAQTLHPVAGQGFNIGIRDAADLARELVAGEDRDCGAPEVLARFAARRQTDARMGVRFTDSLVGLFSTANPLLSAGRGAGLALLDMFPPARRLLVERMIYGA